MEDEDGYTALSFQSRKGASGAAPSDGKPDVPHPLRWHQITLWIACFVIVILVSAVVALVLQLEAEKGKAEAAIARYTSTCPVKCDVSTGNFQSLLRSIVCNQSQGSSSVNSTCKLCPAHWHLHRDKCYWPSTEVKSWNESRDACSARSSHLVMIQDKEEMEYLKQIIQDTHTYWAGLFVSFPEKKWIWITGSQLDQNLFKEPNHSEEEYCGAVKNSKITSDTCNAEFRWVCQKEPILI